MNFRDSSIQRVTTHAVAARAGVSQPTVSLVLSRNPKARLSAETRERVLRAAAELHYQPNVVARSLAQGRSYAFGVIVPDLRNPFFADVISGAQKVAAEAGFAVLLCEARDVPVERHLEALRGRLIDGVLVDASGASTLPRDALRSLNVVLIDEPSETWPGVASDALGAGVLAADHLIELGHRDIAFIGPAEDVYAMRMRERGFSIALREAGIPLRSERLRRAAGTIAGGMEAMRAILALRSRPTAVFCANDLVALGALKACATDNVAVPGDISIAGCDDIEMARLVTPELTSISIPARELGARAARLLLRRIDGADIKTTRPLPVRLIVRGSTARPRTAA